MSATINLGPWSSYTSEEHQGLYYSDWTLKNGAKPQRKAYYCIRIEHGERAFIHFPPTPLSGLVFVRRYKLHFLLGPKHLKHPISFERCPAWPVLTTCSFDHELVMDDVKIFIITWLVSTFSPKVQNKAVEWALNPVFENLTIHDSVKIGAWFVRSFKKTSSPSIQS